MGVFKGRIFYGCKIVPSKDGIILRAGSKYMYNLDSRNETVFSNVPFPAQKYRKIKIQGNSEKGSDDIGSAVCLCKEG